MNVFGMGPMEILLIVVLALIVFGPAKLPEIMGQVGKAIADFRRATSELSDEFNRTIQAELQETRSVVDDTKAAVTGVHTSINSALTGTAAPVRTAVPANGLPAANGISAAAAEPIVNGTNGAVAAPEKPPLADTTQWSWETAAPPPPKAAVQTPAPAVAEEIQMPAVAPEPEPAPPPPAPTPRKSGARNEILPPY